MIDQFGRKIEYARISVTDRCNLRCRYCMPAEGVMKTASVEIFSIKEILCVSKILSWLGIRKIRLTGGEPLLRKNLSLLIRRLKALPGIERVTLTTNGVLLKTCAAELISAGLDGINLSLDTLDEKIFTDLTRRKLFANVYDGLQTLLEANLSVKLNCVPLRGVNDSELVKLAALAKDKPVKVRFIELMPIGCAFESGLRSVPSAELFAILEKQFGQLIPVSERNALQGPAQYFQPKNFIGQIGFIDALEHKFCSACNRIRLTAEGFLKPCLSFDTGLDIKKLLRAGVSESELAEKVRETIYRKPREHLFQLGIRNEELGMYRIGG